MQEGMPEGKEEGMARYLTHRSCPRCPASTNRFTRRLTNRRAAGGRRSTRRLLGQVHACNHACISACLRAYMHAGWHAPLESRCTVHTYLRAYMSTCMHACIQGAMRLSQAGRGTAQRGLLQRRRRRRCLRRCLRRRPHVPALTLTLTPTLILRACVKDTIGPARSLLATRRTGLMPSG